jgi:ParB-like chromosome segregation protein Spo0J
MSDVVTLKAAIYEYDDHPLAALFPLIDGEEYDALAISIRKLGILNPITLYQGMILDGRNRYRGAKEVEHKFSDRDFVPLPPDRDPMAFVLASNAHRRQLNTKQKRELIAKLIQSYPALDDPVIARMVSVDRKTVASVREERKQLVAEIKAKWKVLSTVERREIVAELRLELVEILSPPNSEAVTRASSA